MPYLSKVQKKYIISFAILIIATAVLRYFWSSWCTTDISGFLYSFIIMGWGITVGRRITHKRMRRLLNYEITMMVLLFAARMFKYTVFFGVPVVYRASYYIYIDLEIIISCGALLLSLFIGTTEDAGFSPAIWAVKIINIIFILFVSSNELHWKLYTFKNYRNGEYETEYGWLYYVAVIVGMVQLIGATVIIIKKCSISSLKKYWYIPLIPFAIGFPLMVVYYMSGGSPSLFGRKLYNFQEVFCLTVASMLEIGIKIGMIPSCSGYDGMFRRSHINAAIIDKDGEYRYQSLNYGSEYEADHVRINEKAISGGKVVWMEDLEAISSLNEILADTVEIIESENTLIEKENAAKEESSRYETMNRLYNSIADFSDSRLRAIDEELLKDSEDEEEFKKHLSKSLVLGSYVKRRSNLTLLAAEGRGICLDELFLSLNESMTYIRLCGINCRINPMGKDMREKKLPEKEIIGFYDIFQEVVEAVLAKVHNIMVSIRDNGKTVFKISVDVDTEEIFEACETILKKQSAVYDKVITSGEDGILSIYVETVNRQEVVG